MRVVKPLSWFNVLGYGLGDMANNFAFSMGTLFLLNYYTDVVGIPVAAAGTMLAAMRIYESIMDMIAGRIVDRTSTRYGRFRPFLLCGSLPLMLLSIAVFSVPTAWGANEKLIYAYITYALLGTAYSFVNIPYGSLATVMTQQPRERARLGVARTFMAVCTASFLTMVVGPSVARLNGAALQAWLTELTLILAVVGVILYFICFKSTREIVAREVEHPKLIDSIGTLFTNYPLLMLCVSALCVLVGYSSSGAALIYFARYVLGDAKQFFVAIGLIGLFSAIITVPTVPVLVGRVGKKQTFLVGLAIAALGYGALFAAPETSKVWVFASFGAASLGVRVSMSVMWALEADTVEYGEWRTGMRIEGLNYSFFSLTRKCGRSIGGSIPAFLLATSGYIPNAVVQNDVARQGIQQAVALVPGIAFATAFAIMLFYPLTDLRFSELINEIKKRSSAKTVSVQ